VDLFYSVSFTLGRVAGIRLRAHVAVDWSRAAAEEIIHEIGQIGNVATATAVVVEFLHTYRARAIEDSPKYTIDFSVYVE